MLRVSPFILVLKKRKYKTNQKYTMLYLKTERKKPTFFCFLQPNRFSLFFVVDVFQSFFCDVLQCDLHKNMSNHTRLHFFSFMFSDGWTTNDLIYQWKSQGAVQFVANLSLPGGFKMDGHANVKCDVATATGKPFSTMTSL